MKFTQLLLVAGVASMIGCGGGSSAVKVVPASGVVKFKGSPVTNADVVFYPEKGPAATAKTDAQGAFQMRTNGQLGGTPGKNKVTVGSAQADAVPPSDGRAIQFANKSAFNKRYSDQGTTDLVVTLTDAGDKNLVLELTD